MPAGTEQHFPALLYRAWPEHAHACEFVDHGRLRLGSLQAYQKMEDSSRQDFSEGVAHYFRWGIRADETFDPSTGSSTIRRQPGRISTEVEMVLNRVFVFCCSLPTVELHHLRTSFGSHIVRIDDPEQLAKDIRTALVERNLGFAKGIEARSVRYDKGLNVADLLDPMVNWSVCNYQKPPEFHLDREFRFIAIMQMQGSMNNDADYIELDLGGPRSYARMV